jgi:hypothetical protein
VRRLERIEFGGNGSESKDNVRTLRRRIVSLEREISRKVRRREAQEASGQSWGGSIHPREVSSLLGEDEALVEFFVTGDAIVALVFTKGRREFRILPSGSGAVREIVRSIRFQLDLMAATAARPIGTLDFHRSSAEVDLRSLHDALLAPLKDMLPQRGRLIIVPHSFLHQVPFESLHDGTDYIDNRWEIARCPTADFLIRRRGRRRKIRSVLIAGTVKDGPAFVEPELRTVASKFPRSSCRILKDPSPTEILDEMHSADAIHLSTHSVFREDNPIFSRMSLRDGALFLADILDHRLKAGIVVLSACNSGQVFAGEGDDLSGVAHGFLAAGARLLVASLWRIHDEATEAWMSAFYEHLTSEAQGDPVKALNGACQDVRRTWNHPFYWGGFCVHGS